jgi:CheY-like chemotaxis protein
MDESSGRTPAESARSRLAANPARDNLADDLVGALLATRDSAERKRLLAQLMVSDRFLSMGTLAGAVAHEINNPLTAVIGNLELAVGTIGEHSAPATEREKELLELVHEALSAAARVRDIVRDYQRIVTEVGGEVQAQSTTLRLRVPAFAQEGAAAAARPTTKGKRQRAGTVLVIDDDESSAATVRRMLARQHIITTFSSAHEALKEISAGKTYDLILCDVMMPDVTGMDFFGQLSTIAPQMAERVVFITGGAYTQGARAFLERVSNRCLYKPFSAGELRALVSELID